jgi:hypothetical protein
MMTELIDVFFGCRHSRYSFPVTIRGTKPRPQAGALTGTYVACLDCGREFPYDWQARVRGLACHEASRVSLT